MSSAANRVNSVCFFFVSFLLLLAASTAMDVQGSIFCLTSQNKTTPIQGATAKIKCTARSGGAVSWVSGATNSNGFYKASSSSSSSKLRDCKAFLESSPLAGCNSPTDINGGRSGGALIPFSSGSHNEHFSAKPFFYSPN